jgi:hypothetical protein
MNMSDDVNELKQAEKDKMAGWETDFATESDVAKIKAEEEAGPIKGQGQAWHTWLALVLIAVGLLALFGGVNIGFGWWWFFIFLAPWCWGKGSCSR